MSIIPGGVSQDDAIAERDAAHRSVTGLIAEIDAVPREQQDAAIHAGFVWEQWLNWQAAFQSWYDRTKDWWTQWSEPREVRDEADRWIAESGAMRKRALDAGMWSGHPGHGVDPVVPPSSNKSVLPSAKQTEGLLAAGRGIAMWTAIAVATYLVLRRK